MTVESQNRESQTREPQTREPQTWRSRSEAETEAVGARLAEALSPDGTMLLRGDLGSGKTVLVRGMAVPLGIDRQEIQSPTYTLVHEHHGTGGRLVHVDLYRLEPETEDPEAWTSLGLDELLTGPGIKAIEWPERLGSPPRGAVWVTLRTLEDGEREIVCTAGGPPV